MLSAIAARLAGTVVPWRALALAAAVAAAFAAGWLVNGWRHDADLADLRSTHANALAAANARAVRAQRTLGARISRMDARYTAELQEKVDAVEDLRAAVADGRRRLRLAAACPGGLSESDASAGLGDGAGPRLTADAEQAYFALRTQIDRVTSQLAACQAWARAVSD